MRLIGYVRVSRVAGRDGERFISPDVQRDRIGSYAAAQGHAVTDILEDLDQPGSRYERPGFQEALRRVETGEADGIIVAAIDRFARSVPDAAAALRRLDDAGAVLVSVADALDTSTPVGKFARMMMLALAELELDRIRQSWDTTRARAISRGVAIQKAPVGYQRGDDGRLKIDPAAAAVIREVFRRRASGESWRTLCNLLDEKLPRNGAGRWPIQTVATIVANRTYLGEARAGEYVNRDAHPAIVTRAEWEAAQSARKLVSARNGGEPALLAGIIRCGGCGQTMTRQGSGRRGYTNYACRKGHSSTRCDAPARISTIRADGHVETVFLDWLRTEPIVAAGLPTGDVERLEEHVAAAEAELDLYRDETLIAIVGKDTYRAGLEQRAQTVNDARAELAHARDETALAGVPRAGLLELWPELKIGERRRIIAAAVETVHCQRATATGKGTPAATRLEIVWREQRPAQRRLALAQHG